MPRISRAASNRDKQHLLSLATLTNSQEIKWQLTDLTVGGWSLAWSQTFITWTMKEESVPSSLQFQA